MGASRVEATFFTNSLAVMGMLVSTTVNSRLFDFLDYARSHRESLLYMVGKANVDARTCTRIEVWRVQDREGPTAYSTYLMMTFRCQMRRFGF